MSHDLVTKLENLGLTPELAQRAIEDRDGRYAQAMVDAAKSGTSSVVRPEFSVWRTLQLGTDQPTDPAAELERLGFKVSDWAKQLLEKTPFASEPTSVDLVRVTVAELGFTKGATTTEIYERALAFGLNRLPAEAGYRLRKELTDEPVGEWRFIGMEPITVSDGSPHVFGMGHGGVGRWLEALYAHHAFHWSPGRAWVFARS